MSSVQMKRPQAMPMVNRRTPECAKDLDKPSAPPNTVTVTGFSREEVLFRSDKANAIQIRDDNGYIFALFVQIKKGAWGFSTRGDPDWEENLKLYGNNDLK